MRRKQIIPGLNNSTKFRFIIREASNPKGIEFGMTMTVQEFFDKSCMSNITAIVWGSLLKFSNDNQVHGGNGRNFLGGVYTEHCSLDDRQYNVQIDLM